MVELSAATRERLRDLFTPDDANEAERLLVEECADNLPAIGGPATPIRLERIRFAALRRSDGRIERLREAVALAQTDWRDLLVAAGFAHDVDAHARWWPPRRRS